MSQGETLIIIIINSLLQTNVHIHVKYIYIYNLYKVTKYDKKCTGITYRDRLKTM